jgi:alcohol dehydrogenase
MTPSKAPVELPQVKSLEVKPSEVKPFDVNPFEFNGLPTRVVLGEGALATIGDQVDRLGAARVMIVCGPKTGRTRMVAAVKAALGTRLAATFDAIAEHSGIRIVEDGAALAQRSAADLLLAVGGGSASDTAKAIAILLAEGGPLERHHTVFVPPDRYIPQPLPHPKLPIVAIPTTLSAAEVTPGLGIRRESDGAKLLFWDVKLAPRLILLDPRANLEVPLAVMATTGMNAFAHCVEGLYSKVRNPISEGLALQGIRMLHAALPAMARAPDDVQARAGAMVGAHLSGMVIANARVGIHHGICHCLGAMGGLSHGVANSVMLPFAMRYNLDVAAAQMRLAAVAMGLDVRELSDRDAALAAIDATEALKRAIGVPLRLRDTGLDRSLFPAIAEHAMGDRGLFFNPRPTSDPRAVLALLEEAW